MRSLQLGSVQECGCTEDTMFVHSLVLQVESMAGTVWLRQRHEHTRAHQHVPDRSAQLLFWHSGRGAAGQPTGGTFASGVRRAHGDNDAGVVTVACGSLLLITSAGLFKRELSLARGCVGHCGRLFLLRRSSRRRRHHLHGGWRQHAYVCLDSSV